MAIQLQFAEQDWQRVEKDWSAWWEGELERPLVLLWGLKSVPPRVEAFASNYPLEMSVEEVIARYTAYLEAFHFIGDAWPKWVPNFGPGIPAGFLGAKVERRPETVWFSPPQEGLKIRDLHLKFDPQNIWWQRLQAMLHCAVETWGNAVTIGHTSLGGNLDILASFRTTQQLLFDVMDTPEEVDRLVREITTYWLKFYNDTYEIIRQTGRGTTFWMDMWSSKRCASLQSDFSYMFSPRMFERFVMPDLLACCDAIDHPIYHLDGKGEIPHLDMLLSIKKLRGIQWVPGDGAPPPEEWLWLLKKIRDGGKLCHLTLSPEGALKIARALGGRGFVFVIDRLMKPEEAQALYKELVTK